MSQTRVVIAVFASDIEAHAELWDAHDAEEIFRTPLVIVQRNHGTPGTADAARRALDMAAGEASDRYYHVVEVLW